jgi:DNA-binding NarL/FixJ family response regulator
MTASPEKKPRIVLIDDHPKALMAASQIMKDEFEIVATVGNSEAGLDAVSMLKPDIVIIDIGMPGRDGFETARRMKEYFCTTRIVFLTLTEDVEYACAARDMGGSYVVKRRMRTDLMTAAREAMRGNLFFSPILPS